MSLEEKVNWALRSEQTVPRQVVRQYGVLLGQSLWGRGYTSPEQIQNFLKPRLASIQTPFRIKNLEQASERIIEAFLKNEKIGIYGDYDIDGMSSIALLRDFFSDCHYENVVHYQPDRLTEGYGLHSHVIKRWKEDESVSLIITVDNGITAVEEVLFAKNLGVDVIVTDHHSAIEGKTPDTPWILNPNQPEDRSSLGYLCGAGVAYYLCMGLKIKLKERAYFERKGIPEIDLKKYLDLFALATVADQVKLCDENRALLKAALPLLLNSQRPGLKELLWRTLRSFDAVSTRDIAFAIAPKLNAASRMGQGHLSLDLLLAKDQGEAVSLVEKILDINDERSRVQAEIVESAVKQVEENEYQQDAVLVLAGPWHEGVLGIVAAKICEKYSKPAVILGEHEDSYRGSMRSFNGVNCVELLEACQGNLIKWGGHPAAAGLQLSKEKLIEFRKQAISYTREALAKAGLQEPVFFDGFLPEIKDMTLKEVKELSALSPCGVGNPDPLFCLNKLSLEKMRVMKDLHVRFDLNPFVQVLGFFKAELCQKLIDRGVRFIDVLVCPEVNRFRDKDRLQLRIEHVRVNEC